MQLIYIGLALVGGYYVLAGLVILWSVFLTSLSLPFAALHDFINRKKGPPSHRKKIADLQKFLDQHERELNSRYEKMYFSNVPASGSLDENGIPYL